MYFGIKIIAVGGASDYQPFVLENIAKNDRRIRYRNVVHHHIADAVLYQPLCNGFGHTFGVAIHRPVHNDHAFFGFVAAQLVVDVHCFGCLFFPYRSVSGANDFDIQRGEFLERFLDGCTVFAYNICVVAIHLVPVFIQIHFRVNDTSIQCAETTECIA